MKRLSSVAFGVAFVLALPSGSHTLCADVTGDGAIRAGDALTVLKKAVGQSVQLNCSCLTCGSTNTSAAALSHCADSNGDGQIAAADALAGLKVAVGQNLTLHCSCAACQDGTTTTLSECPPLGGLHNVTFIEVFSCSEPSGGGGPAFCVDDNSSDSIRFSHKGNGSYEVRDVPDTGFVYNGTLGCKTFVWNALSPGQYTEHGSWTFSSNLSSFSGSSSYVALDASYSGDCNTTGAAAPETPPNPPPAAGCQ